MLERVSDKILDRFWVCQFDEPLELPPGVPREHSERRFFGPLRDVLAASGLFDPEFTAEDVQRAFGVAEVNNYELANKSGNCGIRGLLPLTSLLSHSCVPNCRLAISSGGNGRYINSSQ